MKTILVSSAEKMPEENYNFKPTEAVRSYGQIVGHLADAQYNFCSLALGETNPGLKIEQTKTTKADLVDFEAGIGLSERQRTKVILRVDRKSTRLNSSHT